MNKLRSSLKPFLKYVIFVWKNKAQSECFSYTPGQQFCRDLFNEFKQCQHPLSLSSKRLVRSGSKYSLFYHETHNNIRINPSYLLILAEVLYNQELLQNLYMYVSIIIKLYNNDKWEYSI